MLPFLVFLSVALTDCFGLWALGADTSFFAPKAVLNGLTVDGFFASVVFSPDGAILLSRLVCASAAVLFLSVSAAKLSS